MAGKNTTVSLTLTVKGQQASAEIKKLTDQQVQGTNKINQAWTQIGSAQARFVNTAKAGTQATMNTARAGDQILRTNRMLEGVLRQQSIQTKLQSQMLKQQANTVQQIARGMKQAEQSSKRTQQNIQQTSSMWQKGTAIAGGAFGGYMAAKAVVATPLQRNRNFSASIFDASASITNGFTGMSNAQAAAANRELIEYTKNAVRNGHGTLEGVSAAAGILAASGNYDKTADLKQPLLAVAKSSFASGASEEDMAKLVQQTKQFGVAVDRTQASLDRMMSSGFAGGFELKDMAQYLPVVLGAATKAGYSGERGLNTVTTHLQLARKYTGTAGEAATNIEDLYGLVNQKHFKDAIAKNISVEAGDPTKNGKKGAQVFDLTQYLVNSQLKGVDSTTAIANLMNRQLSKNSEYNKLNNDLVNAIKSKNTEQADRLKQAIELVIAGQFGDIFHNKQSLSGISSIVTGVKNGSYDEMFNKSWNGVGSVERIAEIKGDNEFAKAQALEQESLLAQLKIYESVNSKLSDFEGGLVNVMRSNEGLAASAVAATGALTVLAGVAGGGALLSKGGGAVATAGGGAAAGAASGAASKATKIGGLLKGAALGAVVVAADDAVTGLFDKAVEKVTGYKSDKRSPMEIYMDAQKQKESQDNSQMIAQQQAASKFLGDIVNKLNSLINVTMQNKPLPISIPVGGLLGDISKNAVTEEKRHGAALLMYKPK